VTNAFDGVLSVFASDLDGDGDQDVLGAAQYAGSVRWWEQTDTAWQEHLLDANLAGAVAVHAADVDGDGLIDVLAAASQANDIVWWRNLGTSWSRSLIDGGFAGAHDVKTADVDGDGDIDVIGAARDLDEIAWWENTTGSGTAWTKHVVNSTFDDTRGVFPADIDGDGDVDIVGAADLAGEVAWWENTTGSGTTWTRHLVSASFAKAIKVHAADVDGDGDLDILGAASRDGIAWWENTTGSGTAWTAHTIDSSLSGAWGVDAADIDGDGDIDVLGVAVWHDTVAWWENTTGSGTAWQRVDMPTTTALDGAVAVHAADLDGDGLPDVLAGGIFADTIQWWANTWATSTAGN
jgi:hypothetical protein